MAASKMVSVSAARARAVKRAEQDMRQWAAYGGHDATLEILLHPPTQKSAGPNPAAAVEWKRSWQTIADANPGPTTTGLTAGGSSVTGSSTSVQVQWVQKQWSNLGTQTLPERVVLVGADAIASFAGTAAVRAWRIIRGRADRIRQLPVSVDASDGAVAAAIRTHGRAILNLAPADFNTLLHVVDWVCENPASGFRIRQLPIRGIDTKWLERHRSLVDALHTAVTGRPRLGLLNAPDTVRIRFLDPLLRPGGLTDITAPVDQLAKLSFGPALPGQPVPTPRVIFVFENLETVLAMPETPGAVVVHGSGYAAKLLWSIPWIAEGRIIYWGDLDSDGFAILHVLRSGCDNVTSVLMDEDTLLAYRDLWVPEPKPAAGAYPTLTEGEQQALRRVRAEDNVRLEQERIEWNVALSALTRAAYAF
jgi:hypothetical protein